MDENVPPAEFGYRNVAPVFVDSGDCQPPLLLALQEPERLVCIFWEINHPEVGENAYHHRYQALDEKHVPPAGDSTFPV